ncbi:MAG: T9SS type A sorting domain-containing protein, partial [Bacteroidota bacterium]
SNERFIQPANNNDIFVGDGADGYAKASFIQATNNDIFVGDGADGYAKASFIQLTNNDIFVGDGADGYDQTSFIQLTNNDIFGGGIADGYELEAFIQLTNNTIFGGGVADGYDLEVFVQMTNNNSIFGGGVADGYDLTSFIQLSNNGIFGGGIADGYDMAVTLIEIIQTYSAFNPFDLETLKKEDDLSFNTFPTPFSNYLNISIPENEEELLVDNTLSLINTKGKLVATYNFDGTNIRIDASKFPAGLYTIVVKSKDKILSSQVVKMRASQND